MCPTNAYGVQVWQRRWLVLPVPVLQQRTVRNPSRCITVACYPCLWRSTQHAHAVHVACTACKLRRRQKRPRHPPPLLPAKNHTYDRATKHDDDNDNDNEDDDFTLPCHRRQTHLQRHNISTTTTTTTFFLPMCAPP